MGNNQSSGTNSSGLYDPSRFESPTNIISVGPSSPDTPVKNGLNSSPTKYNGDISNRNLQVRNLTNLESNSVARISVNTGAFNAQKNRHRSVQELHNLALPRIQVMNPNTGFRICRNGNNNQKLIYRVPQYIHDRILVWEDACKGELSNDEYISNCLRAAEFVQREHTDHCLLVHCGEFFGDNPRGREVSQLNICICG